MTFSALADFDWLELLDEKPILSTAAAGLGDRTVLKSSE